MDTLYNWLKDTEIAYDEITDAFTEIVNLGIQVMFRRLMIYTTLDQPVFLRFYNPLSEVWSVLKIPAKPADAPGFSLVFDQFQHNGSLELKHETGFAPTEGALKLVTWRGV